MVQVRHSFARLTGCFRHAVWGAGVGAVLGVLVTVRVQGGCCLGVLFGAVWGAGAGLFWGVAFLQD